MKAEEWKSRIDRRLGEIADADVKIELGLKGFVPRKGQRIIKTYHPAFGNYSEKEWAEKREEWKKKLEAYAGKYNLLYYRKATIGGGSRLYLVWDEELYWEKQREAETGVSGIDYTGIESY
jgi:hypothetical protein